MEYVRVALHLDVPPVRLVTVRLVEHASTQQPQSNTVIATALKAQS